MPEALGFTLAELRAATSDEVVVGRLLERNAREKPDEEFVRFEDGTAWTRGEGLDRARTAAAALREHGVGAGDRVAIFLPNGPEFLTTWWGAALLGAVTVPMNTAFRGGVLERSLRVSGPAVVVASRDLAERLDAIDCRVQRVDPGRISGHRGTLSALPEVHLWDDNVLVQTSGTSGPSKFVRVSHLSPYAGYASILASQGCSAEDVFQIDLPMFHMAALGYVHACLVTRTCMVVRTRPALDRYWEAMRDDDVTCGILMSSMVPYLLGQPPTPVERDHRLRFMMSVPVPADVGAFKRRFSIPKLVALYGSTEVSAALIGEGTPDLPAGFCGRPRPGWELRVVDAHDQDVPVGTVGEAIVRADRPFVLASGYFDDAVATATAWRHGWYHTGDLLRAEADGSYCFIDRAGDAIRRRGENISAYEVEAAIATHPDVSEVACVAVPSDTGVDHEVKAWIVPRAESHVDFAALLAHCARTMPHFMVPRYFERVEELPKTPSAKVQKYLLRERGNTETTWDSREHGLAVTRRGLETLAVQS